jgi:GT2 family glycosyltransferase/glycosyltransferase involved in cell wall biosynthesis
MTKPIRGHVDGFEGRFICGWAISETDDRNCLVKVVTADGKELARGRASHPREDLRGISPGRTNVGFRILLDKPADISELHVTVDKIPLPGSPIIIGRGIFDGAVRVQSGIVEGVITERSATTTPPQIVVRDQYNRVVAEGYGIFPPGHDLHKPAIARIDLKLRPECFGFDELELRTFANGVPFSRTLCQARLLGYLDQISNEKCRGWLFSPDAPGQQFEIEVFRDGVRIGRGMCELPREDLREVHPEALRAGFDIDLKVPQIQHDSPAQISIRLAGTEKELFEGPFLIGPRAGLVAAARRAASLVSADPALSPAERQAVQQAMAELIAKRRHGPSLIRERLEKRPQALPQQRRLNIIIPIYKGVDITRVCIESVLDTRNPERDVVILVNDRSPDPGMAPMLQTYSSDQNVYILENQTNLGFVSSVNRAMGFCRVGDVVMLNSDTRVFPGAWDEMARLLDSNPDIGTITALSNNATIFSYPHVSLVTGEALKDASWKELAANALVENAGKIVDVPTGHGFCMLVRREVLDRVGHLDTRFGRGYGEENDLCQRAADLGWRNVAACAVLVEHRESVSFEGDKAALLNVNLPQLNALYPDYTPTVMAYEREDGLRQARWPLDRLRLRRARDQGVRFALVVENWLDGGTKTAIKDMELAYGYGGRQRITLSCRPDGARELNATDPAIQAVYAPDEDDALFATLDDVGVDLVLVHHLMGYSAAFVERLGAWGGARQMKFYMHDFYTLCPRVTLLNALGRFCEAADSETCARCVEMGGAHEASRIEGFQPAEHRALFDGFLRCCSEVIAPSNDTVDWAKRVFSDIAIASAPHPQVGRVFSKNIRDGDPNQIILIGAIGPHKGSRRLLELAREARLSQPALRFHVIGYTDIDRELRAVGNVTITGHYEPEELAGLVERAGGRTALFLHEWPETFSYTLSEALELGLWPVVPGLGAPADRVRERGVGSVSIGPIDIDFVVRASKGLVH